MSAAELYAELLPLLDSPSRDPVRDVAVGHGQRAWAFCPCHADGTKYGKRSLSLSPVYGLDCFAGCAFRDVVSALQERAGIHPGRTAPAQHVPHGRRARGRGLGEVTGSWTYQDEEAQTLFRVVRLERQSA